MGKAVVTVASGGLPIVESTVGGTPVTEAANGYGMPVTKVVGKPGMPVVFETVATWPPSSGGVLAPPLDGLSATGAWSASRKLLTAYGGPFLNAPGGLTDTLYDQSGNTRNLTAAGTERPTPDTVNSIAALLFNGVTHALKNASNMSTFITDTTGYMIATVRITAFTSNSTSGFATAPIIEGNSANVGMNIGGTGGSGNYYANIWDTGERKTVHPVALNTIYVLEFRHQGGTLFSRVNGGTELSIAAATGSAMGTLNVGGLSVVFSGHIFELATFQTVPLLAQRDAVAQNFKTYVGA